ncbi:MAG: T9SS type A sorting domain-containing protein, partial [Chitinophagales bacterium]|nr:T9SS type A sorting domain-containing protein [Chitinophagales bacterium]
VSEQVESNLKLINDVYLNTLAIGIDTFTQAQLNVLYYLALQCPLAGGTPVYRARGMLAGIIDTIYDDTQLCSEAGYNYKKERTPKPQPNIFANTGQQYYLQPNPAKNLVTIRALIDIEGEVQLQLLDYTGKVIQQDVIHFTERKYTMPITNLSTGVYLLRLRTIATNKTFVQKLSIE